MVKPRAPKSTRAGPGRPESPARDPPGLDQGGEREIRDVGLHRPEAGERAIAAVAAADHALPTDERCKPLEPLRDEEQMLER